jgi:hypothetical protein
MVEVPLVVFPKDQVRKKVDDPLVVVQNVVDGIPLVVQSMVDEVSLVEVQNEYNDELLMLLDDVEVGMEV